MAEIADISPEESVRQNLETYCMEVGSQYEQYAKRSARRFVDYIGKDTVVDLGCGDGAAVKEFIKNGNKVIAVDINKDKLKHVDQRADTVCADALSFLDKQTAKNIFMHHSLEHIVNYQEVLNKVSTQLQKGGYAYIAVPRGDTVHSVHHVAFEQPGELVPKGLKIVTSWESGGDEWKEMGVIVRK